MPRASECTGEAYNLLYLQAFCPIPGLIFTGSGPLLVSWACFRVSPVRRSHSACWQILPICGMNSDCLLNGANH